MKNIVKNLSLLVLLISVMSCNKDEIDIEDTEDFGDFIQEEMDYQNIPAMSTLIFNENGILQEGYYGKSHLEQDISLEPDHLFLLASISKVVTATALLQLQEDGLFMLDDDINNYLPFSVSIPNYSGAITFKTLLTHTSGIADGSALDDQYYIGQDSPVALADYLENYLTPNGSLYNATENFYNFSPGEEHEYSNTGNALIGLLVEEISGINFNTYCQQNIFEPLGMNDTFWRLDEISQTIVQPYEYYDDDYDAIQHYTFTDYPNGGLRSTGRDMFKLLRAFVNDGVSNSHQLLNPNTVNSMITPQIPNIDNEVGLHLFIMDSEYGLWGHDGGEEGVATIMAFHPTTKIGAIILANEGEADLEEILAEAYKLGLSL